MQKKKKKNKPGDGKTKEDEKYGEERIKTILKTRNNKEKKVEIYKGRKQKDVG